MNAVFKFREIRPLRQAGYTGYKESTIDINSIGHVPAALSQATTGDAIAIAVLKKTLDIQAQGALQLIQALPQPAPSSTPNLGNNLNTYA